MVNTIHDFFEHTTVLGVRARREGAVRATVLSAVPIVCLSMISLLVVSVGVVGVVKCQKERKEERREK